jgi:hypothetical protein
MNQEYSRQIVKKLLWLSDLLISELDSRSKYSWHNHFMFIDKRIDKYLKKLEKSKTIKSLDWLTNEVWPDQWLLQQHITAELIRTDPFLPKELRVKISNYYEKRASSMADIFTKVMTKFCTDLYNGKITGLDQKLKNVAWERISGAYFKKGWDSQRAAKKIEEFRTDIENYLTDLK